MQLVTVPTYHPAELVELDGAIAIEVDAVQQERQLRLANLQYSIEQYSTAWQQHSYSLRVAQVAQCSDESVLLPLFQATSAAA